VSAAPVPIPAGAPGISAGAPIRQSSLWRDAWQRYLRNRGAVVAGSIFLLVVAYCIFAPILSPHDPNRVHFPDAYQGPSWSHPFGTDQFGRDLFTRTALGGRISIGIGFGATLTILAIGVVYGAVSGFVGGKFDNGLMRFLDALYGLPYTACLTCRSRSWRWRSSARSISGRW